MNVDATAKTEAVMGASMGAPSDDESIQSAPAAAHEPTPALVLADIPAVYTEREERANTWTHAVGIPLALVMTAALLSRATGFFQTFSAVAFGFGMVAVFAASACYHAVRDPILKRRLRVLDHSSIYLMIAGLYTPYMLVALLDQGGIPVTIAVWSAAVVGVLSEILWVGRPKWLIGGIYVLMGWGLILKGTAIYAAIGPTGFWLLFAGGTTCSLGVIFYVQKSREFMHAVFHGFVLLSMFPTWMSIYSHVLS